MRRISAYFISIQAAIFFSLLTAAGQDTLFIPLKIHAGIEAIGPVTYFIDKQILRTEGYVSADLNEKLGVAFETGYLDYNYSQFNYTFLNKGFFIRTGVDFNLLKPKKSLGKYWAGIGLRYGLSHYQWEVPEFRQSNYWGDFTSSIAPAKSWGHFIEASPGMRAEIFSNFSMGWSVSLRMLLSSGSSGGLKPIYFPGFGDAEKRFSTGFRYFFVWSIPYKKIRVIIRKPEPEEDEDIEDNTNQNKTQGSGSPAFRPQQPGNTNR